MLKVIAQDFIKLEHLEAVMPLYKELVEKMSFLQSFYWSERSWTFCIYRRVARPGCIRYALWNWAFQEISSYDWPISKSTWNILAHEWIFTIWQVNRLEKF